MEQALIADITYVPVFDVSQFEGRPAVSPPVLRWHLVEQALHLHERSPIPRQKNFLRLPHPSTGAVQEYFGEHATGEEPLPCSLVDDVIFMEAARSEPEDSGQRIHGEFDASLEIAVECS